MRKLVSVSKSLVTVLVLSSCLLAPQFAGAEDLTGRIGIFADGAATMPVGPEFTGDPTIDNKDLALGAGVRYGLSKNWGIGLSYEDVVVDNGVQFRPASLIGSYSFWPEKRLTPIVYAGLGLAALAKDNNYNNLSGKLAGGLEYFITPSFSLSGLVSYYIMNKNGTSTEVLQAGTAGLRATWFFSVAKAKEAVTSSSEYKAAQQAAEEQRQKAAAALKEQQDKAAAAAKAAEEQARAQAQAAAEQAASQAPANPLDTAPVAGKPVSVQINIKFDTGKAVVKPEYFAEIQKIADFMKKYPATQTEIQGHSDNTGSEAYNITLSQKRADSVRSALIDRFGINAARLTAVGYGPKQPIATNDTAEGRQANRRVMATISTIEK